MISEVIEKLFVLGIVDTLFIAFAGSTSKHGNVLLRWFGASTVHDLGLEERAGVALFVLIFGYLTVVLLVATPGAQLLLSGSVDDVTVSTFGMLRGIFVGQLHRILQETNISQHRYIVFLHKADIQLFRRDLLSSIRNECAPFRLFLDSLLFILHLLSALVISFFMETVNQFLLAMTTLGFLVALRTI